MLPKEKGLSQKEAGTLLEKFGPNTLQEKSSPNDFLIFISQLKSPLVYVLLIATAVALLLNHFSDALIIFVAVLINTIVGFIQERRAGHALYALKKLVTPTAIVVRDGKRQKIDARGLVPGDIVLLSQGEKVPGDAVLISANRLYLDEAILTGESVPITKNAKDKVYMSTIVASGQGVARVEVTGKDTQVGSIAQNIEEDSFDSPLKRQISSFSKNLLILVIILTLFVFLIGLFTGKDLFEIVTTAVALAVSAIPEGLLVSLTVILAIGMQRMLKRKGLVRNLTSAETLGGVTTICVDKTGTLTHGQMQVEKVIGDEKKLAEQAILANDLDDPLVISAFKWARGNVADFVDKFPRIDSIPFSSKERFFASLNKWKDEKHILFVNGAPDDLLKWSNLEEKDKESIRKTIEDLTKGGRRLIGFAQKEISSKATNIKESDVKSGLSWIGILAFSDPVREGVREALAKSQKAGITVIVITGDYPATAQAVLAEIGIPVKSQEIMTGFELEKISVEELSEKLKSIRLFARTTPGDKLKIVEALKASGEVVAMMGDGVNDAPAINKADIGIVVGDATDVARESADLVLLDSNFATIVSAVEEGRGIFDNLRKIILYLLSDAFGEIVTVVSAIILGLPLPITAVQILWINLISDGFPDLALTVDPKRPGLMDEPPRSPKENLVTSWMKILIMVVSVSSGIVAFLFFRFVYLDAKDLTLARSVAFLTLGINSLIYVFSVRLLTNPFWKGKVFENRWLVVSVLAGFVLQVIPFASQSTRDFFGIVSLPPLYWLIAFFLSLSMFIIVEVSKLVLRIKTK